MGFPRWYVPDGGTKPAHLPLGAAQVKAKVIRGPDGGPGWIYGGILEPDEPGWTPDPAGWWANTRGLEPAALAKPCPIDGVVVAYGNREWHVPVLVTRGPAGTLIAAAERIRTVRGWDLPEDLKAPTAQALDLARRWLAGDIAGTESAAEQVALSALGLNYHLTLTEAISGQWWPEGLPARLAAAVMGVADA